MHLSCGPANRVEPVRRPDATGLQRCALQAAIPRLASGLLLLGAIASTPVAVYPQVIPALSDPFLEVGMQTSGSVELDALLEVTIFGIDVLSLQVRLPQDRRGDLERIAGSEASIDAVGDSLGELVLTTERLWARQEVLRDMEMERLVSGILETVERGVEAGWVPPRYHGSLEAELHLLFSFLEQDGARQGDEIFFEVRGDTVRTVYRTADGTIEADRSTAARGARAASIPSFFAPGTRFRDDLVESVLRMTGR